MPSQIAFIIGGTGFTGGHVLSLLHTSHPEISAICLVRDASPAKLSSLQKLNPNTSMVEGTMDDAELISKTAETADIVIHMAHSDHVSSVEAVLTGLRKQVESSSDRSPLYLHMSGLGIIADNVLGEKVEKMKEWTDVGLQLSDCPPKNTHLVVDRKIVETRVHSQGRIRTCILFPGLIYGFGKDGRPSSWVTLYRDLAKAAGHVGTWGPGEVTQYCIHVRDVAQAVLCVLDAQLQGKISKDNDGLFFVTSQEPTLSWKEINERIGKAMFSKGLLESPDWKPFPPAVTDPLGDYGWSLLGSNGHGRADRLAEMGWDAAWTKKEPLDAVISEMIEAGVGVGIPS